MRNLRGTYVHRGDTDRRRRRIQQAMLLAGVLAASAAVYSLREPEEARAASAEAVPVVVEEAPFYVRGEARRLYNELAQAKGQLALVNAQLERAKQVMKYSSEYRIGADLAGLIFDVALAEGVDPALAFQLVKVESNFNQRATSPVGAVGLAQVMVGTARYFEPGISRDRLYDAETNLRIGFRYLRALINENNGDVRTALLIYNRGPVAVQAARDAGRDPANGYEKAVMRGYKGTGRMD